MSKSIGKGTLILVASGLICKLLGAFFRLPLTNILGIEGIGVFQMVMSVYSFALILTSGGVTNALSKFVSQARARGDYGKVRALLRTALTYTLLFGLLGGIVLFFFASPIASLQGAASGALSYRLMVLLIPLGGVIAAMRGIFQGYENMFPTAVSQILEQAIKFSLGILFAFLFAKSGMSAGIFGAFLGVTLGELCAIIFLSIYMHFKTNFASATEKNIKLPFLKAALPLSLGASVLPLVGAIDSFIVVSRLSLAGFSSQAATALFGLQTGVVGAILNFPLILSTSISMAILPSVSYMEAQLSGESERAIAKSLKIMWLTLMPLSFGIAAVCRPLYMIVYPSLSPEILNFAVNLTYFGALATTITALMQFFVALLQAKGHFNFCMVSYLVGGALKVLCVVTLCSIREINIYGVVIGNIVLSSAVTIMALIKNKKKISVGVFDLTLPLLSACAMALSIALFYSKFDLSPILALISGVIMGGAVYVFFTLPITSEIFREFIHTRQTEKESGSEIE